MRKIFTSLIAFAVLAFSIFLFNSTPAESNSTSATKTAAAVGFDTAQAVSFEQNVPDLCLRFATSNCFLECRIFYDLPPNDYGFSGESVANLTRAEPV